MTLGDKLKLIRTENLLSPREAALRLDLNLNTLLEWESGQSSPNIMELKQLSDFYQISFEYLLDNEISDVNSKEIYGNKKSLLYKFIHLFKK